METTSRHDIAVDWNVKHQFKQTNTTLKGKINQRRHYTRETVGLQTFTRSDQRAHV